LQGVLGVYMFFMTPLVIVTAIVSLPIIGLGVWASMRLGAPRPAQPSLEQPALE